MAGLFAVCCLVLLKLQEVGEMDLASNFFLANGVPLPQLGLGVWRASGQQAAGTVAFALQQGYRLVDTAAFYENEIQVGEGLRQSGVAREKVFVTSKVWISDMGYDKTMCAFEKTVNNLGVQILDMYMLHWPAVGLWESSWHALEDLYAQGRVRAIGVCNFPVRVLRQMQQTARVIPMVNQVQFHPLHSCSDVYYYCKKKGIVLQAWAPLARGMLFGNQRITTIAAKYGKTPAQILLRWDLQMGVATIPKSVNKERILQNADIFDFELQEQEVEDILAMNENKSLSQAPPEVEL